MSLNTLELRLAFHHMGNHVSMACYYTLSHSAQKHYLWADDYMGLLGYSIDSSVTLAGFMCACICIAYNPGHNICSD